MSDNKLRTRPEDFWRIMEDHTTQSVLSASMRKMVIDNIDENGNIAVKESGTGALMDENYPRLVFREPLPGDSVLVAEIPGRGKQADPTRIVIGVIQTTAFDYSSIGGGGTTTNLLTTLSNWTQFQATVTTTTPGHLITNNTGGAYYNGLNINEEDDWAINCTFTYTGNMEFHLGINNSSPSSPGTGLREVLILLDHRTSNGDWYVQTEDEVGYEVFGSIFNTGVAITLSLQWNQSTHTLSATLTQGSHVESLSASDTTGALANPPHHVFFMASGNSGTVDFTSFSVTTGGTSSGGGGGSGTGLTDAEVRARIYMLGG